MRISAIIIDDEKLARIRLKRMLTEFESITVIGEAQNGREGLELIKTNQPDVIFLDIKMPLLSGFEMLAELPQSPYIIFTTAYDQYALQAFEENTIDYLLKPISKIKLNRAIMKLNDILKRGEFTNININKLMESLEKHKNVIKRFSVKLGDKILLLPADEVYFFHSEDKYTFLHTAENDFIISFTLKELENRLDPEKFLRVHRSDIINIDYVQSIHHWFGGKLLVKLKNGKEIFVSRHYVNDFKQKIHL